MDGVKVFGWLTLSIYTLYVVTRCYYSKQHFEEEEEKEEEKEQEQEQEQEEEQVKAGASVCWAEEQEQEEDQVKAGASVCWAEEQEQEEEQVKAGASVCWAEEQEQEEEQVKAGASVCWAELERDVLGEILGRLSLTDQARFRAVCTDWLVASHSHSNSALKTKSLPWQGCRYPYTSEFQIYDPLSSPNHLASRQIITWSDFGIQSPDYVHVIGIKHNWLFLSLRKSNRLFWNVVLLFSPLTKRIITLPKFDYPDTFEFASTFSTHPDSQDCVFCLVDAHEDDEIHVLTYRYGDKEWTATQFNMHPDFIPCFFSFTPHIISGILYILSPFGGQVASYNILNGEFNFDRLLVDEFVIENQICCCKQIISFELNGELMILCYDRDVEKDAAAIRGQQFIRRYDRLSKVWIPVTTLADYALFFSTSFINVSLINTKDDTTCNGVLPNKVYRFFEGGCLVYSLEDGRLVQFKSINSNLLEDGGDNLPEYKYNYAFPDTRKAYWLEAPRVHSSSDNQEVRSFRDEGQNFLVRFCVGISKCNIFLWIMVLAIVCFSTSLVPLVRA